MCPSFSLFCSCHLNQASIQIYISQTKKKFSAVFGRKFDPTTVLRPCQPLACYWRGGVGIFTVLFTREEVSSILAATTRSRPRGSFGNHCSCLWRRRPRRSFYSARRGYEDDGGEGCVGGDLSRPGGAQLFPFLCPFVPNFTFTFASESEIWSCTILFCTVSNSM